MWLGMVIILCILYICYRIFGGIFKSILEFLYELISCIFKSMGMNGRMAYKAAKALVAVIILIAIMKMF